MTLTISRIRRDDLQILFGLMTPEDYTASFPGEDYTTDTARWDALSLGYFASCAGGLAIYVIRAGDAIVATVTWAAGDEIGFWVRADQRRQGVATAALALFFRFYGGRRIYKACCWADNAASLAFLSRLGFQETGASAIRDRPVRYFRLDPTFDAQDGLRHGVDRSGILPVKNGHRSIGGVRFDLKNLPVHLAGS